MRQFRKFTDTIKDDLKNSARFRRALLSEVVRLMLADDLPTAKAVLLEYIEGTVGLDDLGTAIDRTPSSLRSLLGPRSKPQADTLLKVIAYLQKTEGITLKVRAAKTTLADVEVDVAA